MLWLAVIVLVGLIGLGFLGLWWLASIRTAIMPPPSGKKLAPYFDELMSKLGLPGLRAKFRAATVLSEGLSLELNILPGREGAAAVVFVPGTSVYSLIYAEFMYKLNQQGYHVIGFDPRGHGLSGGLRGSYTIAELVRDTRAVINYAMENYSPEVFVAGSSQGGIVAFYVAAHETRLKGCICHNIADLAATESVRLTRAPGLSRLLKPLLVKSARLLPDLRVPISLYLNLKKEKNRVFGNAAAMIKQDPLALKSIAIKSLASLATAPLPCPVEKIPTPVLVLHGERDEIFPLDYIESIYRRLPEPKALQVVKGRPHLILTDYVDEVVPAVTDWMKKMLSRA